MATAAHPRKIYASTASSSPTGSDELDGVMELSINRSATVLDTTDFKDASGYKTKILGLKDISFSLKGDFERADGPQGVLRTAYENGTTVYLTDLPDGTNGYTFPVLVTGFDESGSVDGKNETSFSITGNGAPVVRP